MVFDPDKCDENRGDSFLCYSHSKFQDPNLKNEKPVKEEEEGDEPT